MHTRSNSELVRQGVEPGTTDADEIRDVSGELTLFLQGLEELSHGQSMVVDGALNPRIWNLQCRRVHVLRQESKSLRVQLQAERERAARLVTEKLELAASRRTIQQQKLAERETSQKRLQAELEMNQALAERVRKLEGMLAAIHESRSWKLVNKLKRSLSPGVNGLRYLRRMLMPAPPISVK